MRRVGREVSSDSLVASGSDALFDSVISASTLAAAILYLTVGIRVEAWLGAAISVIIIRSGIDLLRGTTSEILGERINHELARNVKKTINSFPEVEGAYDLIIHSYGPEKLIGSVHIAVPESMTVGELDHLERAIVLKVMEETQVVMAGISVYSISRSPRAREVESAIRDYVMTQPGVLQMPCSRCTASISMSRRNASASTSSSTTLPRIDVKPYLRFRRRSKKCIRTTKFRSSSTAMSQTEMELCEQMPVSGKRTRAFFHSGYRDQAPAGSNAAATFFSSSRILRCCGQTFSQPPQPMQLPARPPFSVRSWYQIRWFSSW